MPVRTTTVDPNLPGHGGGRPQAHRLRRAPGRRRAPVQPRLRQRARAPAAHAKLGPEFFEDRYTIGVWAWETDVVPASWDRAFGIVDEIWVYSSYVVELLSHAAPCPVVRVPLPILAPEPSRCRAAVRDARRVHLPVHLRLLLDAAAQEPARPDRGVHPRVRAGRGPAPAAEELQRRLQARAPGPAARGGRRSPGHPHRRPLRQRGRARDADGARRLLRLAAPRRGLRADAGRGDGAGQAGDRHGLLVEPRLHDAPTTPTSSTTR